MDEELSNVAFGFNVHRYTKERRCDFIKKAYKKMALKWHPDKSVEAGPLTNSLFSSSRLVCLPQPPLWPHTRSLCGSTSTSTHGVLVYLGHTCGVLPAPATRSLFSPA